MADIRNIDMEGGEIFVSLRISKDEYTLLGQKTENLMIVPSAKDSMTYELTTGKLGNSNRIMIPKRMLNREGIDSMRKKVPCSVFRSNGDTYLLIKLSESRQGIPEFEEDR
jgi:hypothetical protein